MRQQEALPDPLLSHGLHDDLGWALRTISLAFQAKALDAVRDLPGGPRGYLVLTAVSTGDARSQLALAQALSIDKTQMTYLLDELQTAGLIERVTSPTDRRVRLVRATDSGREALQAARQATRLVEHDVLNVLGDDERRTLIGLLAQVAGSLSTSTQAGQ